MLDHFSIWLYRKEFSLLRVFIINFLILTNARAREVRTNEVEIY